MALSAIAARDLSGLAFPRAGARDLARGYYQSFLRVCNGQERDLAGNAQTLDGYRNVVALKTVAAYEFAARSGALVATSSSRAIEQCARCGSHLGWMVQILDDVEALWFPITEDGRELDRPTFPLLMAFSRSDETASGATMTELRKQYERVPRDRRQICSLLDDLGVRAELLGLALDHRDQGLECLGAPLNPSGQDVVRLWLDWLLRDGERLVRLA
jgi:geranylgeranyl pyrophosphate synthase